MTGPGANEGELIYGDWEEGPDYEPDETVDVYVGTVRHACGHSQQHFNCDPTGLDAEPCSACRPCEGCGEKAVDCRCPVFDPFAGEAPE